MARTTFTREQMERIGGLEKGWLELFRFKGAAPFPCEIAARRNRNFYAAKCLLLSTEQECLEELSEDVDIESFCVALDNIGASEINVLFLASDRPITYFPELDFAENYQLEIPGGVANPNEDQRQAALREAIEEAGLGKGPVALRGDVKVIRTTSLIPLPCPWDAGSHVEVYSIDAALVHGKPQPPAKEGIIPEACQLVPLPKALRFLLQKRAEGICVEGYALTALLALERALWRTDASSIHEWGIF